MRLFRRKTEINDAPRCPACRERVPEGALQCAMCGRDLADVGQTRARDDGEVGAGR